MAFSYLSFYLNNDTPQYGGDMAIEISQRSSILNGDSSNSKMLVLPNHVGTHIDFPRHFSKSGKTLNDYPADFWIFNQPFLINYQAEAEELIDLKGLIDKIPEHTDILIVKTGFQQYRGEEKYWNFNPGLAPGLARLLKTRCNKLKAVGFDFISLSSYQHRMIGREAHKKFLVDNDILIVEDMDLSELNKAVKKLTILPIMIDEADGCPVTIIAEHE